MKRSRIRIATEQDAEELLEIYAPYVENTAITFEYTVPTVQEFAQRIHHVLEKYPYLIAEREDKIVGYAYAGTFKERAAYDWAVETTVYVREDQKKTGVGRALYEALEKILALQNIQNLNACIAYLEIEDQYLTHNSVQFHEHLGYRLVGEFYKCGYKAGRWYNMVWMEKHIGEHEDNPKEVKPFNDIRKLAEKYLTLPTKNTLLTAFRGTSSESLLSYFSDSYSKLILENDKEKCVNQLISTLESGTYDYIISFGQEPVIKDKVYIELAGRLGDTVYETDFAVDRFITVLKECGFSVHVSSDAGTSFCNHIYAHGLKYMMERAYETKMVFVHVPFVQNILDFEQFSDKLVRAVSKWEGGNTR